MDGTTYGEWSSTFGCGDADREAMIEVLTGVYTAGFTALQERFGG